MIKDYSGLFWFCFSLYVQFNVSDEVYIQGFPYWGGGGGGGGPPKPNDFFVFRTSPPSKPMPPTMVCTPHLKMKPPI